MTTTHTTNSLSGSEPIKPKNAWKSSVLAPMISGLLFAVAFSRLDCGALCWIALIPLLTSLPKISFKQSIGSGLLFGLTYFGGVLYWVIILGAKEIGVWLGIGAWLIAVFAQTLFAVLFCVSAWIAANAIKRHDGDSAASPKRMLLMLCIPALWTIVEWLRQLGRLGTTWGDISVSQHGFTALIQISKLAGPWAVTFLAILFNTAATGLIWDKRRFKGFAFASAGIIVLSIAYGLFIIKTTRLKPNFIAAALQTNINPNNLWNGKSKPSFAELAYIDNAYVNQGIESASQGASLVVWPEETFPTFLRDDAELSLPVRLEALRYKQTILVGTAENDPNGSNHSGNSLVEVNPDGEFGGSYMKRHLVPFGEYVPYRHIFKFLEAFHLTLYDRIAGKFDQPLIAANPPIGPIGAAICYESSFSELTREQVSRGARILAVVTDDTWYGRTAAPRQHADFSILRAVECDRYVIRSAATGISEIVDPNGRAISMAPLYTKKIVAAGVESRDTLTPYVRYGDYWIGVCAAICVLGAINALLPKTPRNSGR